MAVRLRDKVALVTGAGRGNGRAIALGLAHEGARLVIADISTDNAERTAGEVRAAGGEAAAVRVDVTKRAEVEAMVDAAYREFGRLDILVNNAGVLTRRPFLELPEEEWDRVIGVNLKGVFLCSQAAARRMVESGGGCIINISSVNAVSTTPFTVHYCASKAGVSNLTKGMALALAPSGIRVNAVAPSAILTDMSKGRLDTPEGEAAVLARTPLGRLETSEDLIGPVVFLASSDAEFVTGATLVVDGGWLTM
jgi:NAD(P)-dependent dehydrogenase (short-subunit alcohol dehydrogenase family)